MERDGKESSADADKVAYATPLFPMHPKPAGTNLLFPLSQVEGMVPVDRLGFPRRRSLAPMEETNGRR